MKKIGCSFLLLSVLSYGGGDIRPINESYLNQVEINPKKKLEVNNQQVLINSSSVKKEKNSSKKSLKSEGYYIGLTLAYTSLDGIVNGNTLSNGHPLALISKFGYDFSENFGLEVRAGTGISEDKVSIATNKLNQLLALYMKPGIEVDEHINLFGLLGYGAIKQEINGVTLGSKGMSYGLGTSYAIDDKWALVIDAIRYKTKAVSNNDTYGFGLEYKF